FNSNAQDVSCFQHLVQANVRNKKVLKDAVNNITAKGITDYKKGFSFAFEQLLNVRVFTFSVGQHNYDRGPIQWMACENKGYYYEIPSIGAIRINTQEYLDVLGRPMVLAGDKAKQVQWTNVYLDALNQLILGVMGVDVSLEDIKRLTPRFTLCPNGYYFAIDPNGYVLLHPNLQPKNPKSQEPVTLDFLDAELENDIKVEIRNKMIDGESGEKTFRTLVKSQDESQYQYDGLEDWSSPVCLGKEKIPEKGRSVVACRTDHKGVKARFVVTDGGITRVYPKEAGENWQENPETYEDSFYKRSLDNDNYVFTAPYFNRSGPGAYESGIMVSKAVEIYIQGKLLKPAVVGIKIDINSWIENFTKTSIRDPVMDCVILDDGGFLLMANHDDYTNQIGRFFGEIDPSLMRHLVNISVYAFNKSYDYQSVCEPGAAPKQGAGHRSAYVVSRSPPPPPRPGAVRLRGTGCVDVRNDCHVVFYSHQWQTCYTLAGGPRLLPVEMEEDDFTASLSKQSCITEQTQYFFDNDSKSFSGVLDCGNCSRIFHVEKLMNTNLIFIMVESKGTCPCDTRLLIQAEQTSDGPDPCDMVKQPRYRKGPDVCFDNNVLDGSFCSAGLTFDNAPEKARGGDGKPFLLQYMTLANQGDFA
ncbi:calcium channel, voltage-dependent, alpha 2/delta subunit 1-like protein, partial [Camelus ferus]